MNPQTGGQIKMDSEEAKMSEEKREARREPHILDDIDGDLDEIEAIERANRRVRAFVKIREVMKERKVSGAQIARDTGRSSSQINSCLRGDYPWTNAYGLPKYLYEYLVGRGYAKEADITWMVPAK